MANLSKDIIDMSHGSSDSKESGISSQGPLIALKNRSQKRIYKKPPFLYDKSQRRLNSLKQSSSLMILRSDETMEPGFPKWIPRNASCVDTKTLSWKSKPPAHPTLQALFHTIAGAAGAMVALIIVYPLDSLRILQVVRGGSIPFVIRRQIQKGGFQSFYIGLRVALVGVLFSWGTYFFVYTLAKQRQKARRTKSKALSNIALAIGAGICSTILSNPFWVANTRLKVDLENDRQKRGIFQLLFEIYKTEGIRGWFAGIFPSLILVLNPAIQFALYDYLKKKSLILKEKWRMQQPRTGENEQIKPAQLRTLEAFFLGLFTKLVATIVTYPYLVIKTRAQTKLFNVQDYSASFRCFIAILETEGIQGFYTGLPSKLMATVLSSAIMFSVYEKVLPFSYKFFKISNRP